jgi:hypothetical protein
VADKDTTLISCGQWLGIDVGEMVRRLGQGRIAAPVPGLSLKPDEDTAELVFLGARVRLAQGDAKGAWFAAVAALA